MIDGTTPCMLPDPERPEEAVPRSPTRRRRARSVTLQEHDVAVDQLRVRPPVADRRACTASSTRRIAWRTSPYLYPGQPEQARPIEPLRLASRPAPTRWRRSTWRGHADDRQPRSAPRAVLRRLHRPTPTARALYTHDDPGRSGARPRRRADRRSTSLKGVLTQGHRPRTSLADFPSRPRARPARRRTTPTRGSSGSHPQLTTAVWVGDPDGYTPMVRTSPSSSTDVVHSVQGGTYPARIWQTLHGACASPALPLEDWAGRRPSRPASRRACTCPATSASPSWSAESLPGGSTTTSTTTAAATESRVERHAGDRSSATGAQGNPQRHDDSARCPRSEGAVPDRADLGERSCTSATSRLPA